MLNRKRRSASPVTPSPRHPLTPSSPRRGFTLVELLMSTVLALMVMFGVVSAFALIGQGVSDSRATLEMSGQLRQVATMLKNDLGGATAVMSPPRSPESGEGYLEYTEGPIGPVLPMPPQPIPGTNPQQFTPTVAFNSDVTLPPDSNHPNPWNPPDTTVGDMDDMLLFTVRSRTEPFVGRCALMPGGTAESYDAEIIWFVRGRTLYRRVLLVAPQLPVPGDGAGFYLQNDISVRRVQVSVNNYVLMANTLADLTRPENRYAHWPVHGYVGAGLTDAQRRFPSHPHFFAAGDWSNPSLSGSCWGPQGAPLFVGLMLPTLCECSYRVPPPPTLPITAAWIAGGNLPVLNVQPSGSFDAWRNPHPWQGVQPTTGALTACAGSRVAEDAILQNVIGFDVKAWDPGAPVFAGAGVVLLPGDPGYPSALETQTPISYGAYVDLNYMCGRYNQNFTYVPPPGALEPQFAGPGDARSRTRGTEPFWYGLPPNQWPPFRSAVYDTWSRHYERELGTGRGINGFDDPVGGVADGVVDDPGEMEFPPPYAAPLRGIQVKIRVFEPDSRQVREVTVIQEFVTK